MKQILITGSYGQLGRELQGLSYTHSYKEYKFIHTDRDTLDITDNEQLNRFFGNTSIDCVINCAAYTSVDKAESEQEAARRVNSIAVGYLAEAASRTGASLIHISTDFVFDGFSSVPYKEDDVTNPVSFYGKTKLEGEKAVLQYKHGYVIRTSWLYSPHGNNFFRTILDKGSETDELKVVYDQIGTPTYARDLARVLLLFADFSLCDSNNSGGLYHYSNEGVCSWYDFAWEILRLTGTHCRVIPVETSEYPGIARRPHFSVLNKSKIKSQFSLAIPHWKDSLISCIDQLD